MTCASNTDVPQASLDVRPGAKWQKERKTAKNIQREGFAGGQPPNL
jgi:hypothetical protein